MAARGGRDGGAVRTVWGSATDRGHARVLNEDALLACPPVFLVADGMGGHHAGDVASRVAVEEFSRLLGRATVGADDVHDAVRDVAERVRIEVGARTAGTTIAGAAVTEHDGTPYWLVFNVGDSRVYRWAEGRLEQVTVDHSVVQELLDAGRISTAEAAGHPERHVITRAVGTGPRPEPDYWLLPAVVADRMLVCSDGLTTEVDDDVLAQVLRDVPDPEEAARALVRAALEAGGRDNVSVVVVDVASVHGTADVDVTVEAGLGVPTADGTPDTASACADDPSALPDETTQPRPTRRAAPEVPA